LASALAASLAVSVADARPSSGGSRGSKTFSTPPSTQTAPGAAQPLQRSQTQPGYQNGGMAGAAQQAQRSRFGFGGGLMAGLLGAGLFGLLAGNGLFGGLAGIASFLGLLLQVGLIVGLVMLALRFFRRRSEPALAGAGPNLRQGMGPSGLGGLGGGLGGAGQGGTSPGGMARPGVAQPAPTRSDTLGIGADDYAAFERILGELQTSYGREDADALRRIATPEMFGYLNEELAENTRRGVVNTVTEPRLLQGDLAEAWREGPTDYATVAMRFSIKDATVERASGRVVGGDPNVPTEAVELWTFRRDNRGPWILSAIQQAG
jgi:predicted lipid-binding transport protein (Tim44 family)